MDVAKFNHAGKCCDYDTYSRCYAVARGGPVRLRYAHWCGIILNTARARLSSSVALFGVGGIGLRAVLATDLMNATTITAVDLFDHKMETWGKH